jgi:hypothetical protein
MKHNQERYDRYAGTNYTRPLLPGLRKSLADSGNVERLLDTRSGKTWAAGMRRYLEHTKYRSINLTKLKGNDPYLEFRMAGNRGYHENFEKIKRLMLRYAFMIKISFDPEAFKTEYYKKLKNILIQAADKEALDTKSSREDYKKKKADQTANRGQPAAPEDPNRQFIIQYFNNAKDKISNDIMKSQFSENMRSALKSLDKIRTAPEDERGAYRREAASKLLASAINVLKSDDQTKRQNHNAVLAYKTALVMYNKILKTYEIDKDILRLALRYVPANVRINNRFTNEQMLKFYFDLG